jgi:hypothetical protein
MKKNHDLHFLVEKPLKEKLQKEADQLRVSLAELCRHKLQNSIPLTKSQFLLEKLVSELNISAKFGGA